MKTAEDKSNSGLWKSGIYTPHSCNTCIIAINHCYVYCFLADSKLTLSLVPVAVLGEQNLKDGTLELALCYDQI